METPATPPATKTKLTKAAPEPTLKDATEMVWHKTTIRMYAISESQLEELAAGYNSLHLVFFGISIGAALALGIAWGQSEASQKLYYFSGALVMFGLSILFAINGFSNYRKASNCKKKLYQEAVPIK